MVDHELGFHRQDKAKWSAGQGYRLRNCQQGVFGVAADIPPTTVHMWLYHVHCLTFHPQPHICPLIYVSRQVCFKGLLVVSYDIQCTSCIFPTTAHTKQNNVVYLVIDKRASVYVSSHASAPLEEGSGFDVQGAAGEAPHAWRDVEAIGAHGRGNITSRKQCLWSPPLKAACIIHDPALAMETRIDVGREQQQSKQMKKFETFRVAASRILSTSAVQRGWSFIDNWYSPRHIFIIVNIYLKKKNLVC
jgi:hypothetical protein